MSESQAEARAAYIRELVDAAPRFSQSQISALAIILSPKENKEQQDV